MKRGGRFFRGALFFAVLVLIWEAVVVAAKVPPFLFPGPLDVAQSIRELLLHQELFPAVAASMRRMAIGYSFSLAGGVLVGMLLAASRLADETLGSLLLGLQTLPSICWLPVAILWFGLGEAGILFVVVAGAFLAVASSARDAFRNLPPVLFRAGRTLGATGRGLWFRVALPAAAPALLSGAKLGWSFAWRSLMAGELLSAGAPGLGQMLTMGRELNDLPRVAAVMVVIMILGRTVDRFVFGPAEAAVAARWGTTGR